MQYAPFVKGSFANLYIAYSWRLLSIGYGVEDRSSASIFWEDGGVGDYESFFKAVNEFGWQHVSIRYDEAKVRLY